MRSVFKGLKAAGLIIVFTFSSGSFLQDCTGLSAGGSGDTGSDDGGTSNTGGDSGPGVVCRVAASETGVGGNSNLPVYSTSSLGAQIFQVSEDTELSTIDLYAYYSSSATQITLELYEYSGSGDPDAGTLLASQTFTLTDTAFVSGGPADKVWDSLDLSSAGVTLSAGQDYALVVSADAAYFYMVGSTSGGGQYAGGNRMRYSSGTWNDYPAEDFYFIVNDC